jgi:tetratricopeptide (TPR) repeat protein
VGRAKFALVLWLALLRVATAATQAEQAAAHYQLGEHAYADGRFADALSEFQLGYALAPRPEFLINFAQVHRKLGRLGDAGIDCERYLATGPSPARAADVQRLLAAIREEEATALRLPPAPAAPSPEVAVVAAPAPSPRRPRRGALIGGLVAGGVVLAGVAITLGVVLSRGPSYPGAHASGDFR